MTSSGSSHHAVAPPPAPRWRRMTPRAWLDRAGHCREVSALDDLRLLRGDGLDRRAEDSMWSSATLVIARHAALPHVGRVEPAADANLNDARPRRPPARNTEMRRGQNLEFGRWPVARGDLLVRGNDLVEQLPRSRRRGLAAPSTRIRSRYDTRCGLGVWPVAVSRLAQRGADQRLRAALAVRARDQHATQRVRADHPAREAARVSGRGPGACRNGRAPAGARGSLVVQIVLVGITTFGQSNGSAVGSSSSS